jgi:hypothetical protein
MKYIQQKQFIMVQKKCFRNYDFKFVPVPKRKGDLERSDGMPKSTLEPVKSTLKTSFKLSVWPCRPDPEAGCTARWAMQPIHTHPN